MTELYTPMELFTLSGFVLHSQPMKLASSALRVSSERMRDS